MGGVVSVIPAVLSGVAAVIGVLSKSKRGATHPNPTIQAIEEKQARQKAMEEAQAAREAAAKAEAALRAAQEAANRTKAEHDEAVRRAQETAREMAQLKEMARITSEEAERAKVEHEAALKAAEEEAKKASMNHEKALRASKEENEEARRAERDAIKRWMEGVRPEVWPTVDELRKTKKDRQYTEGKFHFAITGVAGSGKSSLINAFRGLRNGDEGSAATGIVETTSVIARYPDPNPEYPFIWYDVPGAGTLTVSDWQYFNDQGLYIFDCVIVLFDNRFTATDIAILKNCARFKIPSYIVRSKSNQHIINLAADMGYDEGEDDLNNNRTIIRAARDKYIKETQLSVRRNLLEACLPQQKVYMVSHSTLRNVIRMKVPKDAIDEVQLVEDLLKEGQARRCPNA